MGRTEIKSRVYLYLLGVLVLAGFIGLGCGSNKTCTCPTVPELPRLEPTTWLDLDGNGSSDFVFEYFVLQTDDLPSSVATNFLSVRPLGNNQVHYSAGEGCIPLPDNAQIDSALGWSGFSNLLATIGWKIQSGWESQWSGLWAGVSQMNLGLQLVKENSNYFGWAKLSVDAESGELTVHDYAYEPIAEQPILAGVHPNM